MTVLPSGEQVEIEEGSVHATVVEVGGGVRTLRFGGTDILDGYDETEMASAGRGQMLYPWPNRIRDGRYNFGGEEMQLALTEPANRNAIHGLTRWANWIVSTRDRNGVTMWHRLHPSPGYPFTVDLSVRYVLSLRGLTVSTTATNKGENACPFAAGAHPYLRIDANAIDHAVLRVPAATYLRTDDRSIPVERLSVSSSEVDFRAPHRIGSAVLDVAYTELERDQDGHACVDLSSPDGQFTITLWMDEVYRYVMIFSGDTVKPISRRRHGLAVEPMTSPPNAFASGDDLLIIQPGQTVEMEWGLTVRQHPPR